jgi:hypothetical protein
LTDSVVLIAFGSSLLGWGGEYWTKQFNGGDGENVVIGS